MVKDASSQYTKVVGSKFHADGSLRYFPGNTIVAMCQQEPYLSELIWAQDQYKALPFSHKFGFLPHTSFHMTVIELLCDQVRKLTHWSKYLDLDVPLRETDAFFAEKLATVVFPNTIKMVPTRMNLANAITLRLQPIDDDMANILKTFRDEVAEKTGVRFPNHTTYKFHITLAYKLQHFTESETQQYNDVTKQVEQRILSTLNPLRLDKPNFVTFAGMGEFRADLQRPASLLKASDAAVPASLASYAVFCPMYAQTQVSKPMARKFSKLIFKLSNGSR